MIISKVMQITFKYVYYIIILVYLFVIYLIFNVAYLIDDVMLVII